jgi:hypothetical protein
MEWQLRTKTATFWILGKRGGRVTLGIDDTAPGNFATPNLAAGDVCSHVTGYLLWDRLTTNDTPDDISGWTQVW